MNIVEFSDPTRRHIGRALALQAEQIGDKPFILSDELQMTFRQVNTRVNELAGGLAARGLKAGERVAFFMTSGPEVIFLALAANKLGAVWVPVNTDYKGAWLEDTIVRSRPHVLVTDSEHARRLAEVSDRLDVEHILAQGDAGVLPGAEPLADAYPGQSRAGHERLHLRGYLRGALDLRHHRPVQGGDAEPQRVL